MECGQNPSCACDIDTHVETDTLSLELLICHSNEHKCFLHLVTHVFISLHEASCYYGISVSVLVALIAHVTCSVCRGSPHINFIYAEYCNRMITELILVKACTSSRQVVMFISEQLCHWKLTEICPVFRAGHSRLSIVVITPASLSRSSQFELREKLILNEPGEQSIK